MAVTEWVLRGERTIIDMPKTVAIASEKGESSMSTVRTSPDILPPFLKTFSSRRLVPYIQRRDDWPFLIPPSAHDGSWLVRSHAGVMWSSLLGTEVHFNPVIVHQHNRAIEKCLARDVSIRKLEKQV